MHGGYSGGKVNFGLWSKAYQGDGLASNKAISNDFIMVTTDRKRGQCSLACQAERRRWEEEQLPRETRQGCSRLGDVSVGGLRVACDRLSTEKGDCR